AIHGCDYGIKIYHENFIANNSIYNCRYGIYGTEFSIEENKLWNNEHAIHATNNAVVKDCNLTDNGIAIEGGESHLINTFIYNGSINVGQFYFYNGSINGGSIYCTYAEFINSSIENEKEIECSIYASNTIFKKNKRISVDGIFWQCNFTENEIFELNNSYVKNCSFYKNSRGVVLKERNIVENNTFKDNDCAIFIEGDSNVIKNNSLINNQHALCLNSTKNNSIFNNTINLNENGVEISFSSQNRFLKNVFSNNTYAMDIEGNRISHFYNYFENNTINGYPSIYEINGSNFVINESYGFIGLVGCKNVTILNQNIGNNGKSIIIVNSINTSIVGSSIYNSRCGIYIFESENITVKNSSIFLNGVGISLRSSYFNSIINCGISNNNIGVNIFDIQKTDGGNYIDSEFEGNEIGILIQTMGGSKIYGKVDSIKIDGSQGNKVSGNVSKLTVRNAEASISNSEINEIETYSSNLEMENSLINRMSNEKSQLFMQKNEFKSIKCKKCNIQSTNNKFNSGNFEIFNSSIYAVYDEFYNGSHVKISSTNGNISNCIFHHNDFALEMDGNISIYNCSFYENKKAIYAMDGKITKGSIYNNTYGCILNGSVEIAGILFHHNDFALLLNSSHSIIHDNSFWKNYYGIIANENGNRIYHNNFVYNIINAMDESNNTWNLTYPHEGNYWDDYAGSDTNRDGIGDIPYEVGNSWDFYPLMSAYGNAAKIPNKLPNASFKFYPSSPFSFDTIVFIDTSYDENGKNDISSWQWSFGDGSTSNEQNPVHSYSKPGNYTVTLIVKDRAGEESEFHAVLNVTNLPPSASYSYDPKNASSYTMIQFFVSCSDKDGYIVNYTWDFGDGSTGYGSNASHKYSKPGIYKVVLTVVDDLNSTASYSQEIKIENRKPSADFEFYPENPKAGEKISFKDLSSDLDGKIVSWHWDFGDETASNGRNATHAYAKPGSYTVRLTVKDDDGGTATYEEVIEIKEKETPGFGFILLMIALALIAAMRKFK
ncbi:MAG: PKD domain-containing protein, partial [Thermoplasmata archaeon]|nr:PKD domain-containing protein [Thermoplasmata archaeon]